jgi:hypothetical protein
MNREQIRAMRTQARHHDRLRKDAVRVEAARHGFTDPSGAVLLPDTEVSDLNPDTPGWLDEVTRRVAAAAEANPDLVDPSRRLTSPIPSDRTSAYDGLTVTDLDRVLYGT